MSAFEKIDYAGVVLICDAHGIDLPVDCIDATVEIANRAIAQLVTPTLHDAQAVTDERAAFEAWMTSDFPHAPLYRRDMAGSERLGQYCADSVHEMWRAWQARAALSAAAGDDKRDAFISDLKAYADRQYCIGIEQMQRTECLGWEYKAANGVFGKREMAGHEKANKAFGAHNGIYAAIAAASKGDAQ